MGDGGSVRTMELPAFRRAKDLSEVVNGQDVSPELRDYILGRLPGLPGLDQARVFYTTKKSRGKYSKTPVPYICIRYKCVDGKCDLKYDKVSVSYRTEKSPMRFEVCYYPAGERAASREPISDRAAAARFRPMV